jgi:1-acyl-sn-glycerol-3-phosphate acyltransferase
MKIMGRNNIPSSGGFVLACNHISLADPPLAGSFIFRKVNFLAKKELFRNPIFGWLIKSTHAHPVKRGAIDRNAFETAKKILNKGEGLVVFPEGTRGKEGKFLPARPGIGMIARNCLVPVVPSYINGSNRLWSCFWGKDRLGILFGEPISERTVVSYPDDKNGYRRLAEDIMEKIKELKTEFIKRSKRRYNKIGSRVEG